MGGKQSSPPPPAAADDLPEPWEAAEAPGPEDIGNAGWTVLHTVAAAYPTKPSREQQQHAWDFVRTWSHVYPCGHCAAHMRIGLKKHPPDVSSKEAFSVWTCRMHNQVNKHLGKAEFDCSVQNVLKRWHPTYPNVTDDEQVGGQVEPLAPTPWDKPAPQRARPPAPQDGDEEFDALYSRFGPSGNTARARAPASAALAEDPDVKALQEMNCTAFCPKDEGKQRRG
eukprot:TRINITY_DN36212_c0_g1_i1.p2 TRINITY_DN36212_c0_g1~~TRINITY_DN36212_c0_g1_i1.p2  ORF type:complete len:250 (+),score=57.51 TRINITY_DN36212_c0_g1_i1:78-752(+)